MQFENFINKIYEWNDSFKIIAIEAKAILQKPEQNCMWKETVVEISIMMNRRKYIQIF